jgi:hypothetical protein
MMGTDELTFQPGYASTTGLGTWVRTGRNEYAFTIEYLFFRQSDFTFDSRAKVYGKITLAGEDTFTDVAQSDLFDAEGNFINSICLTEEATRMEVEPITSCLDSTMSEKKPATMSQTRSVEQAPSVGKATLVKRLKRQ